MDVPDEGSAEGVGLGVEKQVKNISFLFQNRGLL